MIAEFTVSNYRSIRSQQTISFVPSADKHASREYMHEVRPGVSLLKLGFIYGANASGKSNVLYALDDFRHMMLFQPGSKLDGTEAVPFLLDEQSRDEPTTMTMTFYIDTLRYTMSVAYNKKRILHERLTVAEKGRDAILYTREYDEGKDNAVVTFGTKMKLDRKSKDAVVSNTINNCTVIAAFGKTNVEASSLNMVYEYFAHHMERMLEPRMGIVHFVKDILKRDADGRVKAFLLRMLQASDFNITGINLHEEEEPITPALQKALEVGCLQTADKDEALKRGTLKYDALDFEHEVGCGSFTLPEEFESVGTIRFMGLAALLSRLLLGERFLSIDEVESSIHYELLAYFIKVFLANSRSTSQMLVTTHNLKLLDEDFIRRDAVWFTEKGKDGATSLLRLSGMGLHKTLSPYNAYRQGKLVNLPFLDSVYLNISGNEQEG